MQIAKTIIKRREEASSNRIFILAIYMFSPFLSLLIAIKNYRSNWAKDIVWLFVIFYGYTMVISNDELDANRYRDAFLDMANTETTISNIRQQIYNSETDTVDILQPAVSFLVSRFTDNYKILFLTFALIFGYFYSRNIWLLVENANTNLKKESIPFIITFAFIIGFWQINGFRMWTAAHVFFWGTFQFFLYGKKKSMILVLLTPFIHFSFVFPVLILVIFFLFKNKVHFYFWLYVFTFFLIEIDLAIIKNALYNISPSFLLSRVDSYVNEDYSQTIISNLSARTWHAQYYILVLKWVIFIFMAIIYVKALKVIKTNYALFSLFCFSLLFLGLANIASQIPSGGRFLSLASLFSIASVFLFLEHFPRERIMKLISPITTLALTFFFVVSLRIGFDTISIVTIIGNPISAMITDIDIAFIEFIK